MRMHVRGKGADGKSIDANLDLDSTLKVGDTFVFGVEGDREEEVEILGIEKEKGPDGEIVTTLIVGPIPEYGWADAPHKQD